MEASKDGKQFTLISDKIFSKARDGNSDLLLEYEFTRGNIALQALAILLLSLSVGSVKRKPLLLLGFGVIGCALFILSCKKNGTEISGNDDQQLYVRVVQVDKDGAKSYSKIVRVVRQ
ncbi:hypothetical protein [Niabella hibiscisoli]|uniref:hypothetical protein n=1 Tax=Niabella hibiscisoli TaxID=1825928 RepID=UPI001F0FBF7F|nr:hypothetical protein [Niabella hibiscisoli]MCH5717730.1 hypothetical protein [Niabella hibiscisoli]